MIEVSKHKGLIVYVSISNGQKSSNLGLPPLTEYKIDQWKRNSEPNLPSAGRLSPYQPQVNSVLESWTQTIKRYNI